MSVNESESNYYNEYLFEVNNFFTTDSVSQKLYDITTPIRNLFINNKEILSYSFCRHFGGEPKIAFFCEFLAQVNAISSTSDEFLVENQNYFRKKVPVRLRGIPNLYELIDHDISEVFLPIQLKFLTQKLANSVGKIATTYPEIKKYLQPEYLVEFDYSEFISHKKLYQESLNLSQYLDSQDSRQSFAKIGLPILLGLQNYYAQISGLNKPTISWVLVEELLRLISLIHQLGSSREFALFLYQSKLSEKDEFGWWQLSDREKLKKIENNTEIEHMIQGYKDKYYQTGLLNLENLSLSDKFKPLLMEVLNWAKITKINQK